MCGRYYLDREVEGDLRRLMGVTVPVTETGDILPSMNAPVIRGREEKLLPDIMRWGFPGRAKGQLIINARSETALEKKTFEDSVRNRRCVIPARSFYEWDRDRNRAVFTLEKSRTIFLAGFYKMFELENRFIILTTAANESMIMTHPRMPLMIGENDIKDWIFDDTAVRDFLDASMPQLTKTQEFEQMRFFL